MGESSGSVHGEPCVTRQDVDFDTFNEAARSEHPLKKASIPIGVKRDGDSIGMDG